MIGKFLQNFVEKNHILLTNFL